MEITPVDIVALIGVTAALFGQVYAVWAGKGKTRADEAATLSQTAINLVNELQEQVNGMKMELEAARSEIALLKAENEALVVRIRELEDENRRLKEG